MQDETVLVCVTDQLNCKRLIERGRHEADRMDARLMVLHVRTAAATMMGSADIPQALNSLYAMAREAEADMEIISSREVENTIVDYARGNRAALIVVGASPASGSNMGQALRRRLESIPVEIVE